MITIEKAIEIAKEKMPAWIITEVHDLGIEWLVCFDFGDPPYPGPCHLLINKKTKETRRFFPPEYEGIWPSDENLVWSA